MDGDILVIIFICSLLHTGSYYVLDFSAGSTNRTSGTSATTGPNPNPLHWDRQTILFSVNAWVKSHFTYSGYDMPYLYAGSFDDCI
jgi:hypothetical protein